MTPAIDINTAFSAISQNLAVQTGAVQIAAVQIIDCLVEGVLIAIFAASLLRLAGRQNAGTRFAVWFSALMAIAALPFVGGISRLHSANVSAAGPLSHAAITLPVSWALYVFAAWATLAVWHLIGVARGLWHLHVLRRSCRPVDPTVLSPRLKEILANRATRDVVVCTSDEVHVPTAIGLVKPAIVLPGWVLQELSAEELDHILLHELAHLRRWDDWTNLAQKLVKALLFFHPAVWWIERRVCLEREMACDDAVIAETASPRAYAECLAHLAEKTLVRKTLVQRSMAMAQAALGRIRHTSLRVAQILDVNRPAGGRRAWKPAVSLVGAFALVCVLGISKSPSLIAFRDGAAAPVNHSTVATDYSDSGSARVSRAAFHGQPVRVVPAMMKTKSPDGRLRRDERAAIVQSPLLKRSTAPMVNPVPIHQTNLRLTGDNVVPVVFTETLFVIVEGRDNGPQEQAIYRIQLWRVTVLHSAGDRSSKRIPAKQT